MSRPPPSTTCASTPTTASTCTGHPHQPLGTAARAAHGAPLRASRQAVLVRAVFFAGPSSSSSPGTSPTTSPSTQICASSATPWRVLRLRRSDQPICAHRRQARPRARAYHRSSNRLPQRRPFGPRAVALVHPPASSAPSLVRTSPVASSRCTDSRTAATSSPRTVVLLHAVYLTVPAHRRLRLPPRCSHNVGRHRPRMVFVKLSAPHRQVRVPPPRLLT